MDNEEAKLRDMQAGNAERLQRLATLGVPIPNFTADFLSFFVNHMLSDEDRIRFLGAWELHLQSKIDGLEAQVNKKTLHTPFSREAS